MNESDIIKLSEAALTSLEQLLLTLANNIVVGLFIVVIVALTISAFISLTRVRWFYRREQTQLHKLERILKKLERQPIETVDELRDKLLLVFQRSNDTLVYKRIELVLKLAENGKLGRIQSVNGMIPPGKLIRQQSYFAHFVISVLLIIGLAGTLWAFEDILTNSGLSNAIEGNEIQLEKYTPAIENIYDGLKSAMLASLAGIIGSVILLYVKFNWVQPIQEHFFCHLEWITEIDLIPICSQFEKREPLEQALLNTTRKLDQVLGHSNSLAQQLNTFTEKTGEVVKWFDYVTNKDSSFYQASTQLFNAVATMGGNYDKLTNRIGELVTEHNKSIDKYEIYIKNLEATQQNFTASQNQLVADVGKIPESFQEAINTHAVTLQANNRYLETLNKLTKSLEAQQTDYTIHVKAAVDTMTISLGGINDAIVKLEDFTIAFNQQAQSLIPELTRLGVDPLLHQYVEELKNSLMHTQNEFMISIKQQQETMQQEINQIDSLKQIEQAVKEMHNLLKERPKSRFLSLFKRN